MNPKCLDCDAVATWMRYTQFAGDHPYCDEHASKQSDFDETDSTNFDWHRLKGENE